MLRAKWSISILGIFRDLCLVIDHDVGDRPVSVWGENVDIETPAFKKQVVLSPFVSQIHPPPKKDLNSDLLVDICNLWSEKFNYVNFVFLLY